MSTSLQSRSHLRLNCTTLFIGKEYTKRRIFTHLPLQDVNMTQDEMKKLPVGPHSSTLKETVLLVLVLVRL